MWSHLGGGELKWITAAILTVSFSLSELRPLRRCHSLMSFDSKSVSTCQPEQITFVVHVLCMCVGTSQCVCAVCVCFSVSWLCVCARTRVYVLDHHKINYMVN